jgi:lipopolysaccharide transport system permease protein
MNRPVQYLFDLTLVLTRKEMQVRYKNNVLGYLWSVLQPLSFALVYFIAFKIFMRVQMENYTLYLLTGMFPWQWFANSVNDASGTFTNNASIIKKIKFPRNLLVAATIIKDAIHFILCIPVIMMFCFIYDSPISITWLYGIPILLVLQAVMIYGLSLIISTVNLFFRDLERIVTILVTFLFFLTPIVYNYEMVPENYRQLLALNPMAFLMTSWRGLFLSGQMDWKAILITLVWSVILYGLGQIIYKKLVWRFAEVL